MNLNCRTFETHKSTVDKVVIMVIDALRYDFIASKQVVTDMPFVASLLNASQACLFPCRVHLPTVTMPRIKVPKIYVQLYPMIKFNIMR